MVYSVRVLVWVRLVLCLPLLCFAQRTNDEVRSQQRKSSEGGKKKRVKDQSVQSFKWLLRKRRRFFFRSHDSPFNTHFPLSLLSCTTPHHVQCLALSGLRTPPFSPTYFYSLAISPTATRTTTFVSPVPFSQTPQTPKLPVPPKLFICPCACERKGGRRSCVRAWSDTADGCSAVHARIAS